MLTSSCAALEQPLGSLELCMYDNNNEKKNVKGNGC